MQRRAAARLQVNTARSSTDHAELADAEAFCPPDSLTRRSWHGREWQPRPQQGILQQGGTKEPGLGIRAGSSKMDWAGVHAKSDAHKWHKAAYAQVHVGTLLFSLPLAGEVLACLSSSKAAHHRTSCHPPRSCAATAPGFAPPDPAPHWMPRCSREGGRQQLQNPISEVVA